jgi:SAM-dependent methyltransferase
MAIASTEWAQWGGKAADWVEQELQRGPLYRAVLTAVQARRGQRILDAGCGTGGASAEGVRAGADMVGIDLSEEMLALARTRVPRAHFEQGDLESLPFEDSCFDATIAINSIYYTLDMHHAALELARVTRPGGVVCVSSWGQPEQTDFGPVFERALDFISAKGDARGPFRVSAHGALSALLEAAHLRAPHAGHVGQTACDFVYPNFTTFWRIHQSVSTIAGACRAAGDDPVRQAIQETVEPFRTSTGAIVLRATFQWAIAHKR